MITSEIFKVLVTAKNHIEESSSGKEGKEGRTPAVG